MKIYFFEIDETGIHRAGISANGARSIPAIWSQAGQNFVKTGAAVTHDLTRHDFTEAQEAAYKAFCKSGLLTMDIPGGV